MHMFNVIGVRYGDLEECHLIVGNTLKKVEAEANAKFKELAMEYGASEECMEEHLAEGFFVCARTGHGVFITMPIVKEV